MQDEWTSEHQFSMAAGDDAWQWLARAQDARELAEKLDDPQSKRAMLEIAAGFEQMAERAEVRERLPK